MKSIFWKKEKVYFKIFFSWSIFNIFFIFFICNTVLISVEQQSTSVVHMHMYHYMYTESLYTYIHTHTHTHIHILLQCSFANILFHYGLSQDIELLNIVPWTIQWNLVVLFKNVTTKWTTQFYFSSGRYHACISALYFTYPFFSVFIFALINLLQG